MINKNCSDQLLSLADESKENISYHDSSSSSNICATTSKNSSITHYFTHNIGNSNNNRSTAIGSSSSSSSSGIDSGGVDCESEVVVLDFETTGLSSQKHRVIEVAAVILHGDKAIIRRFIYYVLVINFCTAHVYIACIHKYMHTYSHTYIYIQTYIQYIHNIRVSAVRW